MYIAIEGVIGVGKTTLARMIKQLFDANLLLEVFEENPFLSDFYSDRHRYAFQTQIFFLLSRYQQQHRTVDEYLSEKDFLISDYTFDKDALFARINLSGDELEMYYRVHRALGEKIHIPDLIVYLRASTEVLMNRISKRDRPYERQMESAYIEELNQSYDDFFIENKDKHSSPILTIETDHLDYVKNEGDLKLIENKIRQMLQLSPFQPELPLNE
ncbi:MAG: deoxynucleoside kinase [Anaerolineaceae bacterium]|nr:deoxynucleoside kinase [Anaerolineaceae bacterium]